MSYLMYHYAVVFVERSIPGRALGLLKVTNAQSERRRARTRRWYSLLTLGSALSFCALGISDASAVTTARPRLCHTALGCSEQSLTTHATAFALVSLAVRHGLAAAVVRARHAGRRGCTTDAAE